MSIYSSIPAAHIKRSLFPLRHEINTTMDMGAICPMWKREVLPGDIWKINASLFARLQPMVSAPFTPIKYYLHCWFIPTRLLMAKKFPEIKDPWETFIFGGPKGDGKNDAGDTPVLPRWIPNKSNVQLAGATITNGVQSHKVGNADASGSLWDYFGYPVSVGYHDLNSEGKNASGVDYSRWCPLDFPRIAYNLVWNEFYRDENLEDEVDLDSDNVQYCKWKFDYFTKALPFQQRGEPIAMPLSGTGSAFWSDNVQGTANEGTLCMSNAPYVMPNQKRFQGVATNPTTTDGQYPYIVRSENANLIGPGQTVTCDVGLKDGQVSIPASNLNNNIIDLTNVGTADVTTFRLLFQTQRFMERAARGGVRYIEGLKSFFGTSPHNDVLQRPQFVGGFKQNIIVNEVLQTSATSDGSTPQGNIAGRGITAGGDNIGTLVAREHGWLIAVAWIKPDLYYNSQGIDRESLRVSKFDYYFPQFAHLSEQPVYKAQLYANPSQMSPAQMGEGSAGLFGYQGIYNEYRSAYNTITAGMRDVFDYWTMSRKFSSAPELNSDFITCFPRKDIFAVQNEDVALIDLLIDCKVYRPIPIEAVPGLVDHN